MMMREMRDELKNKRMSKWARKHDSVKWVSSSEIHNKWVQDRSKKMVVIGSDCISLYPNLTKLETADKVPEAIMESEVKWADINYKEAVRYLVLSRPKEWCSRSGPRRVLPHRRHNKGVKPGVTGQGPAGPSTNDEIQWVFPTVELTGWEKKKILSEVLRLGVEMMFSTHCYRFGGNVFRQTEEGPIGLRSTCAVARVVMARWDIKFKNRLKEINIKSELDGRYVDDGRLVIYAIRAGWRWHKGALWYRREWEDEDRALSDIERSKRAIQGAMQGLTSCLTFTVETEEDFADGWLPTLDLKMNISDDNQIWYSFYEKPTGSDKCLQASTALNQNCLMRSLSNEVMRRMANISKHLPTQERVRVLDRFCQ